jgi:galactokinase
VSDALDHDRLADRLAELEPDAVAAAGGRTAIRVVRAPGRVNLIGEHTDYNDGLVLPVAIDLEIRIAHVPADDRRVELTRPDAEGAGERDGFDLDAPARRTGRWIDYVAGVAWALGEAGLEPRGLRGVIGASLPAGAGLSSSAAIELASAWALLGDAAGGIERAELARLAQRAENVHVGVACGLMDQFASACGDRRGAILLDCRTLEHRLVPLPLDEVALVVCDTGSPRRLGRSAYNERRAECEAGLAALQLLEPSIASLRDVPPAMLPDAERALPPLVARRVRHVVTENARVEATVAALEADNLAAVAEAVAASHASLRDDYEVSSPELDAMVEIARGVPGVVAARMTGAGFGGSTIVLLRPDAIDDLRAIVEADYPRRTGLRPVVRAVRPADGAGRIA